VSQKRETLHSTPELSWRLIQSGKAHWWILSLGTQCKYTYLTDYRTWNECCCRTAC